jgi:lactate 2-monooxygenase
MASGSSIEEVAKANGKGPTRYQLYWPQDDNVTISFLKRVKANGYKVLVVTLDTWTLAWRPADLDGGYIPFMKGVGNTTGFTDPVFREKFWNRYGVKFEDKVFEDSQE